MKTNDVLNILHKHQEKWLQIASNLLYRDPSLARFAFTGDGLERDMRARGRVAPGRVQGLRRGAGRRRRAPVAHLPLVRGGLR